MSGDKRASGYVISAPVVHNNAMGLLNDQKSVIVEAVNAEKQLWQLIHSKGPMNTDVQELYRKARSSYEEIIVNDHELAELQDIEYSLWKLHYKHIDEFRNRIRKASVQRKGANLENETLLEGLKSFVSEATDFYQNLIAKIRRSYGLPKDVSVSSGIGISRSIESADMGRCQFSCHRSLVFLGDLARYRELYGNPDAQDRKWSTAARHYLDASLIWPDSGNPQNQLAVLATYLGDEFLALYHCTRSLAVKEPFPDAWNNLILLFEKNRSYGLSDKAIFDFSKPSKRSTIQNTTVDDVLTEQFGIWPLMVRVMGFSYVKSSLEEFPGIFGSSISQLETLFSLDDVHVKTFLESYQLLDGARKGPFRGLQLVCVLIFTVQTLLESKSQKSSHAKYKLQPALIQRALASAYIIMGRIVERCVMGNPLDHSYLLPSILVFVEWLVEFLDKPESSEADEIRINAASYFFGVFVNFLNQLENMGCEFKSHDFAALWEDHELRGFLPVSQSHECLDFSTDRESRREYGDNHECEVRISRILLASMKIVNKPSGSQSLIFYEKMGRKIYAAEAKELQCKRDLEAIEGVSDSVGRDLLHNSPQNIQSPCEPTKESEVKSKEAIKYNLDVDRTSTHVEEEEVILFKPIVRYNSAPLQNLLATTEKVVASSGEPLQRNSSLIFQRQKYGDPSGFRQNLGGSRLKKISWQEPLTESYTITDPVIEQLVDSSRFGMAGDEIGAVSSTEGPPSLSGWVLERESFGVSGEKGKFDPSKYDLGKNDCIASAGVSSLSLGEAAIRDQDAKVTSSYASPHFVCRFSSEGDTAVNGLSSFATTPYSAPPFLPQQPSAPLLPDDALWSSSDSSSYSEYKDSEEMKEQFFEASRVNKYSNLPGVQNCAPTFDPLTIPRFNYEDSTSRFHHYEGNFGQAQASSEPVQRNPPSNLGRFQDEDLSRSSLFDRWTNGLTFDQKEKLRDPQWNPGFQKVYGNSDEHEREKLFHAQRSPNPYWGGAAMKLKSEQQLLLQYLKEKELRLQLESQLRAIQR